MTGAFRFHVSKRAMGTCLAMLACVACAGPGRSLAKPPPLPGAEAPGLPRIDSTFNTDPHAQLGFERQRMPEELAAFVRSLPPGTLALPAALLEKMLTQEFMAVRAIPGAGHTPDLLAGKTPSQDSLATLLVRSFHGRDPAITGYLVQTTVSCSELRGSGTPAEVAAHQEDCPPSSPSQDNRRASWAKSWLHFYIVAAGQPPRDVTATLADPADLVGAKALARYKKLGLSEPFGDVSRLGLAPTLRWVMETDPDRPLPKGDPRSFDKGSMAHVGFIVWSGGRFESRGTVPASFWPCRPLDLKYGTCTTPPNPDDRFVTANPR